MNHLLVSLWDHGVSYWREEVRVAFYRPDIFPRIEKLGFPHNQGMTDTEDRGIRWLQWDHIIHFTTTTTVVAIAFLNPRFLFGNSGVI